MHTRVVLKYISLWCNIRTYLICMPILDTGVIQNFLWQWKVVMEKILRFSDVAHMSFSCAPSCCSKSENLRVMEEVCRETGSWSLGGTARTFLTKELAEAFCLSVWGTFYDGGVACNLVSDPQSVPNICLQFKITVLRHILIFYSIICLLS